MKGTIEVTPEFCAALGKSAEQIKRLSLRALAELAHDKGYRIHVPPFAERTEANADAADLTMVVVSAPEQQQV